MPVSSVVPICINRLISLTQIVDGLPSTMKSRVLFSGFPTKMAAGQRLSVTTARDISATCFWEKDILPKIHGIA